LRTAEMRSDIVDAAVALLGAEGPAALTTRRTASAAGTSPAALAELFGGKPGLIAAMFDVGFEQLDRDLGNVASLDDPVDHLVAIGGAYRVFAAAQPDLFDVMFSRPFIEFAPRQADLAVAKSIYDTFTGRFAALLDQPQRAKVVVDAATGYVALLQGLAAQERAGFLGSRPVSANRRWEAAVRIYLYGAAAPTILNSKDVN